MSINNDVMGIILKDQKVLYASENLGKINVDDGDDAASAYIQSTEANSVNESASTPCVEDTVGKMKQWNDEDE